MDNPLASLFSKYSRLLVLDTETSGLSYRGDEIIEFSAVLVKNSPLGAFLSQQYDELIRLSDGKHLNPAITKLTGITEQALCEKGIEKTALCRDLAALLEAPDTLIIAYNAHFDLSFLYYLLSRDGDPTILRRDKLDLLTVYKDRRPYPHKLKDAITAYGLDGRVQNSHRAIDDVVATVEVMKAMAGECDDFLQYINLFGYNPKYGVEGKRIGSVTYLPQRYYAQNKLYEQVLPSG